MSLIRFQKLRRHGSRRRDIIRSVLSRVIQSIFITGGAAVLIAFVDRNSPETTLTKLVIAVVTAIVVLTTLTADDDP